MGNYAITVKAGLLVTASMLVLPYSHAAEPNQAAEITITDKVLAENVEPIGANLSTISGGTNFAINNHVKNSGFEPMVLRKFIRIDRSGNNWFEWDQEGGPAVWNLNWTGLYNGATVRFYRIVDASGNPLDYSGGTDMSNNSNADHVEFLGESTIPMPGGQFPDGGFISNDDRDGDTANDMQRVYIANDDVDLHFGDYAYIKLKTTEVNDQTSPPDLRENFQGLKGLFSASSSSNKWQPALVAHPLPIPDSFKEPGETCLEVTFPEAGKVSLGQWVYHPNDDGEGQWYSQLHPGASYKVSVWLRAGELGNDGKARFTFSSAYNSASQTDYWSLTDQWQQYTYEFVAPEYPTTGAHIAHNLEFTGPGKVWIDNFVLYRNDAEHDYAPFTPHTNSFKTMMDSVSPKGKKPAMRFYGTIFDSSSIEAMFTNYGNQSYRISWNAGLGDAPSTTIAQVMNWAYKSGDSPETRMVPYLTLNEEYTEDEWMAVVEYLGVPYDSAVDTPESKPYAYLRYKYRGDNGTPWTDEFREILVEYGNETWHNGAGGYGWHGWGRSGYVHQGGIEYGLFARYMFNDHVMKMPAWDKYSLANKIKFTLGGNYSANENSYGEAAVQQGANISYVGHANYVGPKWETNDEGTSTFDDHGIQMTLLGMDQDMKQLISDAANIRDQLNTTAGTDYKVLAYEGGPSGYWSNKDNPEIDELYGKSVAMGLAALDVWLYSSLNGYVHQSYWGLASGGWWSSHTVPEAGGFRAHAGWLALTMRNRYAVGETMLETTHNSEPSISSDGKDIPLISSYVLSDGDSYSVFVLSRKLDGNHDGVDFGDGYTPVTLNLPFDKVSKITRYRLEDPNGNPAEPRSNNREMVNVQIGSEQISTDNFSPKFVINANTGGEAGGIAPGSINLFVFETKAESENPQEPLEPQEPQAPQKQQKSKSSSSGSVSLIGLLTLLFMGFNRRRLKSPSE